MADSVSLLSQIQRSLEEGNYPEMRQLLKQWQKLEPTNPWFHLYVARWYEATEKWEKAEEGYRKLLKTTSHIPKIVTQARQGLGRLEQRLVEIKQQAIAAEKAAPDGEEYGLYILEPIDPQQKKEAAQHFAAIMKTDVYSARLQLPTRGWRIFRTGKLGELRFYANALQQGNIEGFCLSFAQLTSIQVLQVTHISAIDPQLVIHCLDGTQQAITLTLDWSEITQRVEGILPLFEESVEKDGRGKTYYKTKVADYAYFCDLHLGDRQTILRLNDQHYQFQQGIPFFDTADGATNIEQYSVRRNWNNLQKTLAEKMVNTPVWSDFKSFASEARDFPELIKKINPQVNLFRYEEHKDTHWDPAWQLYSTVIFVKMAQQKSQIQAVNN